MHAARNPSSLPLRTDHDLVDGEGAATVLIGEPRWDRRDEALPPARRLRERVPEGQADGLSGGVGDDQLEAVALRVRVEPFEEASGRVERVVDAAPWLAP